VQITKRKKTWANDMESTDKNERVKETGQERELDERENTRKKAQITKRQEIWAYEMESADKNEWEM
jgi:hypothetical protein